MMTTVRYSERSGAESRGPVALPHVPPRGLSTSLGMTENYADVS